MIGLIGTSREEIVGVLRPTEVEIPRKLCKGKRTQSLQVVGMTDTRVPSVRKVVEVL